MEFFSTTLSFLIVIGILVFVHELGHFLTARWTGMRADVFAVGMGPRLLGWNKLTGFSFGPLPKDLELEGRTDYRLCWLPIGGYVKILGMVDESFDTSFEGKPAQPWEFRVKRNWQKAIVLTAGVTMNLILAVVIFWSMPLLFGQEEMVTTSIGWVEPGTIASEAGFEMHDQIVSVDGEPVDTWEDVVEKLALSPVSDTRSVGILRDGNRITKHVDGVEIVRSMSSGKGLGLHPKGMRVQLAGVASFGSAGKGGLKAGDDILAIDSTPIASFAQVQQYVRQHAQQEVRFHIERNGNTMPVPVTVGKDSTIGVEISQRYIGERRSVPFNPVNALTSAVTEVGRTVGLIYASIVHIFRGDVGVRQSIGGPIRIAQMASRSQELGAEPYLRFMALISISLAVMNVLPLPGLDGGHLLFVGIESIIRREIPTKVKMRFQQAGFILLLLLMAFVFYLDLTR
jgi:regulator of sigma E protease